LSQSGYDRDRGAVLCFRLGAIQLLHPANFRSDVTLLGNNAPIFVGLLTWLVFRRRPDSPFRLGLILALGGSSVIVWADLVHHMKFGLGDMISLAAAACFAVYLLAAEKVRETIGTLAFLPGDLLRKPLQSF
jgi:hypothetical protein